MIRNNVWTTLWASLCLTNRPKLPLHVKHMPSCWHYKIQINFHYRLIHMATTKNTYNSYWKLKISHQLQERLGSLTFVRATITNSLYFILDIFQHHDKIHRNPSRRYIKRKVRCLYKCNEIIEKRIPLSTIPHSFSFTSIPFCKQCLDVLYLADQLYIEMEKKMHERSW